MIEEGSIVRREERQGNGARTRYSLIFNSKIRTLLGEPLGDTKIHAVIELNKLSEEEFSVLASSSLIVDFLNVLYGYTLIAIKRKRRGDEVGAESEMRLLKGLAATLMDKLNIYGEYLVERIEKNSFSLKDLERSRIKILNEQRAKHVSIAEKTRLRNDTTEGITPLKISLGELRYKRDRTFKAADFGLKKIHTLTFEPEKNLAVAKLEKMKTL